MLELNKDAFERIPSAKQLAIVPEASHLFEEPGALEQVGKLALGWFREHLAANPEPSSPAEQVAFHPALLGGAR